MQIKKKYMEVPIIQGGMGVGVSLGNLAGHVARCGGIGVISSVNCGFDEPDFVKNTLEANLRVLRREIQKAKEIADGKGLVAVNIMTAVNHYEETCKCAIEAGADGIISGAGLPLRLAEYTRDTDAFCAPIISSAKAAVLMCKHYLKKSGILPDFFVMEGYKAGGHLGFSREELLEHTAKENEENFLEIKSALANAGYEVPVFVAGGVFTQEDVLRFIKLGAAGVQVATRFIATEECDAAPVFKQAMVNAKTEDIRIIVSPVGMPARAIQSPLLERIDSGEKFLANPCNNCLAACKKGDQTPYCISRALIAAVHGDWENGLFFAGENVSRVTEITTVEALMKELW